MTTPTDTLSLASILTAERSAKGMSDADLSRKSGIKHTTLRDVLTGASDPRWGTLSALLAGLGRDLRWLHGQGVRPRAAAGK